MHTKLRRTNGHALTEYVFVIAFCSVLIATAFAFGNGTVFKAVENSKISLQKALTGLIAASENHGKPAKPM